MYKKNMCSCYR